MGLVVRVLAAIWFERHVPVTGDGVWYVSNASTIQEGRGFIEPFAALATGLVRPTASHPPLYPVFLSVARFVGFESLRSLRLWSCVPGTATVLLLGLLGRDLVNERVGLIAAAFAAVFVDLWAQDVGLWSEGLFAFTIVLCAYLAYGYVRAPSAWRAALLAVAIALAALTRAEALALYAILLVPLVVRFGDRSARRRIGWSALGLLVIAAVCAPWVAYNAGRFEHPVLFTTGFGALLASSNCDSTYSGNNVGGWGYICHPELHVDDTMDETVVERKFRGAGFRYIEDHAGRLPVVVPMRLARSFGFWKPVALAKADFQFAHTSRAWLAWVAMFQYWVLLGLGAVGTVVLHRRGVTLLPILAMVGLVVIITVGGYGTTRFRVALDAVLPLVAAVAVDAAWRGRGRGDRSDDERSALTTGAGSLATHS